MQGRAKVSHMGEKDRLACEALARVAEAVPATEYTAYVKYDAYRHVLVASGAHRMMTYYVGDKPAWMGFLGQRDRLLYWSEGDFWPSRISPEKYPHRWWKYFVPEGKETLTMPCSLELLPAWLARTYDIRIKPENLDVLEGIWDDSDSTVFVSFRGMHDPVRLQCGPDVRFIVAQFIGPGGFCLHGGVPTRKKPCELFHTAPGTETVEDKEEEE